MPAPRGNTNAIRHGFRSQKLPGGCGAIVTAASRFREALLDELRMIHGDAVPTLLLAILQTTVRNEQLTQLSYKHLRGLPPDASLSDRLSLMDRISKFSEARDRCLLRLGLPTSAGDLAGHTFLSPITEPAITTPERETKNDDQQLPNGPATA